MTRWREWEVLGREAEREREGEEKVEKGNLSLDISEHIIERRRKKKVVVSISRIETLHSPLDMSWYTLSAMHYIIESENDWVIQRHQMKESAMLTFQLMILLNRKRLHTTGKVICRDWIWTIKEGAAMIIPISICSTDTPYIHNKDIYCFTLSLCSSSTMIDYILEQWIFTCLSDLSSSSFVSLDKQTKWKTSDPSLFLSLYVMFMDLCLSIEITSRELTVSFAFI